MMKKFLVFALVVVTMLTVFGTSVMAAPLQGTDEMENYDKQWKRANDNVAPDPIPDANKKFFYDDFTGFMRGNFQVDADWVAYEVAAGSTLKATALYWPNEEIKSDDDHFAFFTSADGKTWTKLSAANEIEKNTIEKGGDINNLDQRKWNIVTYTTSAVPSGHQYVKIQWPGDGDNLKLTQPWAQRLHKVTVNGPAADTTAADTTAADTTATDTAAADSSENPKTSDPGVAVALAMLAISASGIAAAKVFKKK